jgi:hypothetical protein
MPRAIWSGSISFGLVNAPVKMYSAIDEHNLELHLVHEKDGLRIGYEKVCKKEGKPVPADQIVKAYEVDGGELVYLTAEDFEAAGEKAYRAIEVLDFVPHEEIDPIVFQRSYYLGPADGAEKVYVLLTDARARSPAAALARVRVPALELRDVLVGHVVEVAQHLLVQLARERHDLDPRDLLAVGEARVQEAGERLRVLLLRERPGRLVARREFGVEHDHANAGHASDGKRSSPLRVSLVRVPLGTEPPC